MRAGRGRGARAALALLLALSMPSVSAAASASAAEPAAAAAPAAAPPGIEPLAAGEAPRYMRQLLRELRVLARDTPIELDEARGDALRLTVPAAWLFRTDGVALRPEALVRLDAIALALASPHGLRTRVEISGHSDSLGRRDYNEAFTLRRADALAEYLIARGVDPARLATRGAGEAELREKQEDTPAARQRNRRVEVELRPLRPSRREAS